MTMGVRRESVQIDLTGNLVSEAARAAATVALLRQQLDGLGNVRISTTINQQINQVSQSARRADGSINQLTGRLSLLADGLLILGPGLIPIAAVGSQALGGLAAAGVAAATAGASAIVAFQGVGDAISALAEYDLDPTTANLQKSREALKLLGPDAARFAREFNKMRPVLGDIRDAAAAGWFPGLTRSLDDFERLAPAIEKIFYRAGAEGGSIVEDMVDSLDSKRWRPFLDFLSEEVPTAMRSLANIIGDLAHGAAEMWMAFDPANDRFLAWLEDVASGFDSWASSSEGRDSIEDFLAYARESGPEVAELFTSLVGALTAIVKAAAPLGDEVLTGLTAIANVIEAIADSDMAAPILAGLAALRLFNRMAMVTASTQARMAASTRMTYQSTGLGALPLFGALSPAQIAAMRASDRAARAAQQRRVIAGGVGMAALGGLLASGTADKLNVTNTAMLTLIGTMAGPWGAAVGFAAGGAMDLAAANETLQASIDAVAETSGDDPLSELVAKRKALMDEFINTTNAGGFGGNIGRISSFLSNDDREFADAIARIDEFIIARRELKGLTLVDPLAELGTIFGETTGEILVATSALYDFTDAVAFADGFLGRRANMVAYEESLDQIGKSIRENGQTLNADTEKGRANIRVLDGLAAAGLRWAESLRGAARQDFLKRLSTDVRGAAKAFGLSGRELERFLDKLGLIATKKVKPKLEADETELERSLREMNERLGDLDKKKVSPFVDLFTDPLMIGVAQSKAALNSIPDETVNISIVRRLTTVGQLPGNPGVLPSSADGTTVPKTGMPYADRHLYLLADGEEVISNRRGQADRNRGLLKAINAGRLAEGGTTGIGNGPFSASPMNVDGLSNLFNESKAAARELKAVRRELEQTERALSDERAQRQEMNSYRTEVGGSLAGDLFGGGLSGFDTALAANRNDARSLTRALLKARKKGLDGPLFDVLAASGDLSLVQEFANLGNAAIRRREMQFAGTQSAQTRLGSLAAEEKFNETFAQNAATIERLNRKLDKLQKIDKAVERGARQGSEAGTRKGARGRTRDIGTLVRARR